MTQDTTQRRTFLTLLGGGITTALAGCTSGGDGGDGDGDGGGDATPTPTDTETPTPTESGSGTNEVVWAQNALARTLDPHKVSDLASSVVTINRYDPFVFLNSDTSVRDYVASEWETGNSGRLWTFTLRDDITFHSGNSLTADDVAYSMKRALAVGEGDSTLWGGFLDAENIEAVDDQTVSFELNRPFGPMLATLIRFIVIDSELVRENEVDGEHGEFGDFGQEFLGQDSAGSGPYQLDEWKVDNQTTLEKYDDYWRGWEDNKFDRARIEKVPEESTVKIMMQQGDADLTTPTLSSATFDEMAGYDNVEIQTAIRLDLFHIAFNTQKPPMDDVNVREAIAYSIDYETINEEIFGGHPRAIGSVPREMPGHNDELEPYEQDFERARAALDRASYTVDEINDIGIEHVWIASVPYMENIGLVFKNGLNEIGLEVEMNAQPWPTIAERAVDPEKAPHTQEIFVFAPYPSPDVYTYGMYHPDSAGTLRANSHFTDEELTGILEDARTTADPEERNALYKEAQRIIWENYPSAFINNPRLRVAKNTSLGGYTWKGITGYDFYWWDMFRK